MSSSPSNSTPNNNIGIAPELKTELGKLTDIVGAGKFFNDVNEITKTKIINVPVLALFKTENGKEIMCPTPIPLEKINQDNEINKAKTDFENEITQLSTQSSTSTKIQSKGGYRKTYRNKRNKKRKTHRRKRN